METKIETKNKYYISVSLYYTDSYSKTYNYTTDYKFVDKEKDYDCKTAYYNSEEEAIKDILLGKQLAEQLKEDIKGLQDHYDLYYKIIKVNNRFNEEPVLTKHYYIVDLLDKEQIYYD